MSSFVTKVTPIAKNFVAQHRVVPIIATRLLHHNRAQLLRSFDDFFFSTPPLPLSMPSLLSYSLERNATPSTIFRRSSPFYEITEDNKKFKLTVDVPGVKKSDIKLHLEDEGRVLKLTGERKMQKKDGSVSEMKFEKHFFIDKGIDLHRITANLSNGVLFVSAPKKPENVRDISITEDCENAEDDGVVKEDPMPLDDKAFQNENKFDDLNVFDSLKEELDDSGKSKKEKL
jgi:HSP20 family protein